MLPISDNKKTREIWLSKTAKRTPNVCWGVYCYLSTPVSIFAGPITKRK